MLKLTPYDTGERLEPQLWQRFDDPDSYGRVDFDDAEGCTVLTAYVERRGDGYVFRIASAETIQVEIDEV